jgi:hypothetical protein
MKCGQRGALSVFAFCGERSSYARIMPNYCPHIGVLATPPHFIHRLIEKILQNEKAARRPPYIPIHFA